MKIGDPMSLRHPVTVVCFIFELVFCSVSDVHSHRSAVCAFSF